jgi:predicted acetyltransferase
MATDHPPDESVEAVGAVGVGFQEVRIDQCFQRPGRIPSIKVIERCGGQLDHQYPTRSGAVPVRRYWID